MRNLVFLTLVLATAVSSLSSWALEGRSQTYVGAPYQVPGLTSTTYIDPERIIELPEGSRAAGIELLGGESVRQLSAEQASALLGFGLDINVVLEELAERIGRYVSKEERRLAHYGGEKFGVLDYLFNYRNVQHRKGLHESSLAALDMERRHATHILSLRGKLEPYLMRLTAHGKPRGSFYGWVDKGRLTIVNGIYTNFPQEEGPYPVVIYLESKPESFVERLSYIN